MEISITKNEMKYHEILQQFDRQVQYIPQHVYTSVYVATSDHNPTFH